jgi:hypothetical protein
VRGSLTLADTGEQLFPPLCAINVPLTSGLPVLLTIEISPQLDLGPVDDSVGNRSTDPARSCKSVRGRFAAYFCAMPQSMVVADHGRTPHSPAGCSRGLVADSCRVRSWPPVTIMPVGGASVAHPRVCRSWAFILNIFGAHQGLRAGRRDASFLGFKNPLEPG